MESLLRSNSLMSFSRSTQLIVHHRQRLSSGLNNIFFSTISFSENKQPGVRLSKYIANSGCCSRRAAEKWITDGRVLINGQQPNASNAIVTNKDIIHVDGSRLSPTNIVKEVPLLWAVYKLKGELVDDADPVKNRPLMLHRLKGLADSATAATGKSVNLKPVCRLEFNTEGLCLVSSSGRLARLMNGDLKLKRHYRVRVHGLLTDQKLSGLTKGMYISGVKQPAITASLEKNNGKTISWLKIITAESNFKVVKNCLHSMHLDVTRVICVGFGPYKLDNLPPGAAIRLQVSNDILKIYRES